MIAIDKGVELEKEKSCFPKCETCGSDTHCEHGGFWLACDFIDDFKLVCPVCGEINFFRHVRMYLNVDADACPWCGKLAV